ncbi:MAG: ATP-binding cassette domain-containing protein [Cognatishimia sp.]|uniref:ATP-binding cassette domain-containing protein n=1 Tax=Cognatishimia sp. TaxID=2211648 RepID=UPI003B8B7BFC
MANTENFNLAAPASPTNEPQAQLAMRDRTIPGWVIAISGAFTLAITCCVIGIVLLSVLLHRLVIETGESRMSFILLGLVGLLALAITLLEFAQIKALSGFRRLRELQAIKINAMLCFPIALIVFFIHPLAGLISPLVILIGSITIWQLSKRETQEAPWVFDPLEAISLMAGRDATGAHHAANNQYSHALSKGVRKASFWLAIGAGGAVGTYLVSEEILMPGIVVALTLISAWNVDNCLMFIEEYFSQKLKKPNQNVSNTTLDHSGIDPVAGLQIENLDVVSSEDHALISQLNLSIEPGEIVGLIGESGSGKSLLMQAISDPFSIEHASVSGAIQLNGQNLWLRSSGAQSVPLVFLPEYPIIMAASGSHNLNCFQGDDVTERGRFFLEQMVFSRELVENICKISDARRLPSMHQKSLAISRAFAIGPQVYLFDRPEASLQSAQISAFCNRLDTEARLGRCVLICSDNRTILDKCDRLIVLQGGAIADFGPTNEVRARLDSGWHRFIGTRELKTEAALEEWIRSHFRRNGDEHNRQKACRVATELLAFSCREAIEEQGNQIEFFFKNFKGHCILKLQDGSPSTSSGHIQAAQKIADSEIENSGRNPLANVLIESSNVDFRSEELGRQIICKLRTYDPRRQTPSRL